MRFDVKNKEQALAALAVADDQDRIVWFNESGKSVRLYVNETVVNGVSIMELTRVPSNRGLSRDDWPPKGNGKPAKELGIEVGSEA